MRVMFVAMAFERLAISLLGAIARRSGHQVGLAFSPHIFDDRYWLSVPWLANKLMQDDKYVIDEIVRFRPDVLCFSALTVNYKWMVGVAQKAKLACGAKTVFGGIHASAVPEAVLEDEAVDYVCVGEGDVALPLLLDAIRRGCADRPMPNIYFRGPRGEIVKGPMLPFVQDLDRLPIFERDLWLEHVPLDTHYMTMSTRGCPYRCTYCFNNFFANIPGRDRTSAGAYLRQRSVDHFMAELLEAKRRYRIQYVHIKDDIFTVNTAWLKEFAPRFRREIGVPFHCLSHPQYLDREKVDALKEAGCTSVQFGVESADDDYKTAELRRYEDGDQVDKVMELLQKAGLDRKVDHLLGLPGEQMSAQDKALEIYARHRVERVGINWLVYLPGTEIIQAGLRDGVLTPKDVEKINHGEAVCFIQSRAFVGEGKIHDYLAYEFLYRALPLLPAWWRTRIKLRHVRWMPALALRGIGVLADFLATFRLRETRYFTFYFKFYKIGLINHLRRWLGLGPRNRFGPGLTGPLTDNSWSEYYKSLTREHLNGGSISTSVSAHLAHAAIPEKL